MAWLKKKTSGIIARLTLFSVSSNGIIKNVTMDISTTLFTSA